VSRGDAPSWVLLVENIRWPERVQHLVPIREAGAHVAGHCQCGPKCQTVLGEGNIPVARVYEHRAFS
jgi:hypothetical protein